jgi:hypothetical protein
MHIIFLSWHGYIPWEEVRRVLKNILSLMLGRLAEVKGRRWFVTDESDRRVTEQTHFDHLVTSYFPDHRGLVWIEGDPLPVVPAHVIDEPRASARGFKKSVNIPKKRTQPKKPNSTSKPRSEDRGNPHPPKDDLK